MKKILILFILVSALSGCSLKSNDDDDQNNQLENIKAKVDIDFSDKNAGFVVHGSALHR